MIDETSGVAPEEGGESPEPQGEEQPNPWGAWEQAGVDPSLNPYEVRQYMDWVNDLQQPDTHERALEQAMQQWGHLGEGENLSDLIAIRDQLRYERENPFEQHQQFPYEADEQEYAPHDEEAMYQQQQEYQNYIDPNELRQVWQQDMQDQLQQEREQMAQDMEAERIVNDLHMQLDRLADKENLEDQDKQLVWNLAVQQITQQDLEPDDLPGIMDHTFNQLNDMYARKYAKAAGKAPKASTGGSAAAAPGQPKGGGLEAAMRRTADLMGLDPDDV